MGPIIQNVVATFNVGRTLNLHYIAHRALNVSFKPKQFCAVIMKIRNGPREDGPTKSTTALIFSTGKLVVVGSKSVVESRLACRRFAKKIGKIINSPVFFRDFKIQNVVGSYSHTKKIRLEILTTLLGHGVSYEPEIFPGLIFRMAGSRIVLLIFTSGKMVITGGKSEDEIRDAHSKIVPVLNNFVKQICIPL